MTAGSKWHVTDTLEDLRLLDESHVGANEAAERLGFPTANALERWLYRKGQGEMWRRLKARDAPAAHVTRRTRVKRARLRALARLRAMYPDDYERLVAEEREAPNG